MYIFSHQFVAKLCERFSPHLNLWSFKCSSRTCCHWIVRKSNSRISPTLTVASKFTEFKSVDYSVSGILPEKEVYKTRITQFYKSLRGQAPSYLVDDCQLIADSRCPQLRSAHTNVLTAARQILDLATRFSRSRVREFGTVYSPHCGSLTLNLDTLNDF